jgi:GMP synthase-like glutamine amidotransferase
VNAIHRNSLARAERRASRLSPVPRALIIQHERTGPAGLLADRLEHHGFQLHTWLVSTTGNGHTPDATGFDLVVPLGSAHSVYDVATVGSWIDGELEALRVAHDHGIPVFGICFGAQALCAALGGVVEQSPEYEAGWVEVDTDDDSVVPSGPWFTWHGDRCVLPEDVTVLARNDVAVQAFRHGNSAAVQFHPEVTSDIVQSWMAELDAAWFARKGIDAHAMLDGFEHHRDTALVNLHRMLDRFLDDTRR